MGILTALVGTTVTGLLKELQWLNNGGCLLILLVMVMIKLLLLDGSSRSSRFSSYWFSYDRKFWSIYISSTGIYEITQTIFGSSDYNDTNVSVIMQLSTDTEVLYNTKFIVDLGKSLGNPPSRQTSNQDNHGCNKCFYR